MIIERKQCGELKGTGGWIFIYGRRKTGKTFLVRECSGFDDYYFVTRDRTIIDNEGNAISEETLQSLLRRADDRTVVIDEFQRLGQPFMDFLHYLPQSGRVLILSSTLWLSRRLLGRGSPILGKFREFNISLIDIDDVLLSIEGTNRFRLESSVIMREPLAIQFYEKGVTDSTDLAARTVIGSANTIPSLIGEIFSEEERHLSATYEAILSAVASRHYVSSEISSVVFSKKLIAKDDPSLIQPYLNNMLKLGLVRRIKVYGKNRFQYRVSSPLMSLFYCLNEKYGIAERDVSATELRTEIRELMPFLIEDEVRLRIGVILGMEEQIIESVNADAVFLRFKKPQAILEVKWRERVDIKAVEKNLSGFNVKKKILFVPDRMGLTSNALEIWDVNDLLGK